MMWKRQLWLALALLFVIFLAACVAQNAPAPTAAPRFAGDMTGQLTGALVGRDYGALQELMDNQFRLATWNGEGHLLSPADALKEIQVFYLEPAYSLVIDGADQAAILLGEDPLAYWSPEIKATDALVVQGLGVSGGDEAVLITATRPDGDAVWVGMIVAPGGFPASKNVLPPSAPVSNNMASENVEAAIPIAAAQPVSATRVLLLQTANVYAGPSAASGMVGLLSAGIVADMVDLSADGQWRRIVCPPGASGECWLSADPAVTRPVATPVSEPAPATPPTLTSTPTAFPATPTPAPVAQPAPPQRINFARGATSAQVRDQVTPELPLSYLLRALAGQSIAIEVLSPGNAANFSVSGVTDGQPYKRAAVGEPHITFVAPLTQDHLITVVSETPTDFTMNVVIPPLQPTATPLPQPTPERISFASGTVSATRSGSLQPGETKEYVLKVLAGQTMTIDLRSTDMAANFAVTGVNDSQPYKRIVNEDRLWSMVIPTTQDYRISLMTTAPVEYDLSVLIPPAAATPTSTPSAPQRITFAPGASAATLTGALPPNGEQSYLLRAVVGQTMFVALASPGDVANFSVSGYNSGQVLKPLADPARSWSGRLPGTQDYLVTVVNPSGGSLSYTLVVSFSPLGRTPVPPISQPERISFPSGGTSATVGGPIVSGSVQPYVLRALAGQTMQATVSSPANDVYLSVRGADGQIFQQFAEGQTAWTGVLPKNQDYLLSVYAAGANTTYSLTVAVE